MYKDFFHNVSWFITCIYEGAAEKNVVDAASIVLLRQRAWGKECFGSGHGSMQPEVFSIVIFTD